MPHRPRLWSAIPHGPLDGFDYSADRPFIGWHKPDMLAAIADWLAMDPPRLELATLALNEFVGRCARTAVKEAKNLFTQAELSPISWLDDARKAAREACPPKAKANSRGRVYVILRDGYAEQNGYYGAYVGRTTKDVEARYLQHRDPEEPTAAKGLPKHGIELLYSLFAGWNPLPGLQQLELETRLHHALANAIPKVSGDTLP